MLLAIGGMVKIAGCNLGDWRAPDPEEQDGFPGFHELNCNGDSRVSERSF
jgi:hypothetical protein